MKPLLLAGLVGGLVLLGIGNLSSKEPADQEQADLRAEINKLRHELTAMSKRVEQLEDEMAAVEQVLTSPIWRRRAVSPAEWPARPPEDVDRGMMFDSIRPFPGIAPQRR